MTRRVWLLSKLEAGFNPRRVFWKGPRENHWTDKGERAVQFVREEDADTVGRFLDIPNAAPVWWEHVDEPAAVPGAVMWADCDVDGSPFPPPLPEPEPDPKWARPKAWRDAYRDALARQEGKNLDGSPRRETVPTYPEAEEGEAD